MQLNQFEYPLTLLTQLSCQFLNFVLAHAELMPTGFERRRAAKAIVGVFYIEEIHEGAVLTTVFIYSDRVEAAGRG
ncbi:hypothetical protein [Pseudomonas sp. SM4]|jgi:hypothetical protein|uniref:hypothetical protein n=1 Tax=Pseudomonas sp. SM4 TaxID=3424177 RepID=UPI003F790EFE